MRPEVVQADELDVDAVDLDGAFDFGQTEESRDERGFSGAGASDDAHLLRGQDLHVEVLQNRRLFRSVAQIRVSEDDVALLGPIARRLLRRQRLERSLFVQFGVL